MKVPEVLHEYHSIIQDQLTKGIVEPVPDKIQIMPRSPALKEGTFHYLPHHAVIRRPKYDP